MQIFIWLGDSPIGTWVKESIWGFPGCLVIHAWAMAILVGLGIMHALSVLGLVPGLLPGLLTYSARLIWPAFVASFVSGILLLSAYPETTLTNPVFYVKVTLAFLSLILLLTLRKRCNGLVITATSPASPGLKWHAGGMLLSWFATLAAGRLLYYAYSIF